MTEFFTEVAQPIAFAGAGDGAGDRLAYRVYDPDRVVAGHQHGGPPADRRVLLAQLQLGRLRRLR